jgi:hypothetical protein
VTSPDPSSVRILEILPTTDPSAALASRPTRPLSSTLSNLLLSRLRPYLPHTPVAKAFLDMPSISNKI